MISVAISVLLGLVTLIFGTVAGYGVAQKEKEMEPVVIFLEVIAALCLIAFYFAARLP